jgi:hypothetical protein
MSYADNVLRRRQELNTAFRERYNPMESVVAALSEIDKQAKEDELRQAREKRDVEKYALEKERILAQTEKLNTDRTASEAALAAQREARKAEFEARAARQQEEARLKEQAEARKTGARTLRGMLQGRGQTARDVWGGVGVEEAEKAYAKRLPRALVEGTAEEVARMDEELAAIKERAPKKIPGGLTREEIEEVAGAFGMTFDEALSLVSDMEQEEKDRLEKMGLTGAKTEEALTQADWNRRRGRGTGKATTPEEAARKGRMAALEERKAVADAARAEEKLERDRMAAGSNGVFQLTESQRNKLQDRRTAVLDRATAAKGIRDLIAKYPDMDKYVGSIDQYISGVRAKLGSSAAAEILAALGRASDEYRTAVTGAAASDKEREMLESRVPNSGDTVAAILGKLAVDDEYFKNKFAIIDAQFQANDIRGADALLGITGVAPMETAAPAAPVKKKPSKDVQADIDKFGLED